MALSVIALGLAVSLLAVFLPVGVISALVHADEFGERVVAVARKCRLVRRPPPVLTFDPPIERIAADLRRLSTALRGLREGTPAIRRRGLQTAYDGKLQAACRALGIEQCLGELAGMERELERLRVEVALESAGLRFRSAVT